MTLIGTSILAVTVLIAAIHDARTGFIPDRCSLGGTLLLLLVAACSNVFTEAVSGACSCAGALGLLYVMTRGRGLGLGDVKLAAAIGAGLGVSSGLVALGLAFIFGATIALVLLALRRIERRAAVYFAPYLAAGTFASACALHVGIL